MVKKILLASKFGSNIFTRNTISSFFEDLNKLKDKEIVLDFSSIEFISRSCADEYIKKKQDSRKNIVEANISKEVCSMFNAVQIQYEKAGVPLSFSICRLDKRTIPA